MLQEAGGAGMPLQRPMACRPGGRRIHPAKAAGTESAETKKAGMKAHLGSILLAVLSHNCQATR